jgi:site-specific recombinase XerD
VTPDADQLRHLYATEMLKNGVKLEAVRRLLEHAMVATTVDIYRHLLPDEVRDEHASFAPLNGTRVLP